MKLGPKILELCNFSAGICGVWQRVKQEAELLARKNYKVRVFSSNFIKGSNKRAKPEERIGKVKIKRFKASKLGGESFMSWNFENSALGYNPDVIIAHSYRHLHTTKALKIAKKLGCKVLLVTHAPFGRAETRSFAAKLIVWFYDRFVGRRAINKFDEILAITKWEIPYLLKLGAKREKIKYVPNGIPEEFFKQKKASKQNKILFFGRITPIKDIETLIRAMALVKDKRVALELVGPAEGDYLNFLKSLVKKGKLTGRVKFSKPIYNLKEKIRKIDSAKIFVLPSKSEGMPQALVEAMAREKIVIASDNLGAKDLVVNGKNGYLFNIGNEQDLAKKIDTVLKARSKKMQKEAKKSVEQFSWKKIIERIEKLIR
jgi:glycosyltransferase involved in cell wall biosynthesis